MLPTERKCYTYDGDLLTQVTYPNGGSFQYTYDESGLILSVRDLNGKIYVKNTYDRDSRVTRQEMINDGEYVYFYDTQNRLTTYTEVHTAQRLTVHYNQQVCRSQEMHYATSDGDGNKKGFRQGGEQVVGGETGYAGKHSVGTGTDMRHSRPRG